MKLRPYQLRAIDGVRAAFRRTKRVLLVMPTGGGKTATASALITTSHAKGWPVLFLVHRREIVIDTVRRIRAAGIDCGVVMAGEPRTDAPVQVASVQTIAARAAHPEARFLIWDEAHHTAAETYRTIAAQYPDAFHLGLTATPERSDGVGLRDAFDELVVGATTSELCALGHLAPVDVIAPSARVKALSMDPAEAVAKAARPTVVFCATVKESIDLAERLGPRAAHIDGATSTRERDAILARYAAGELDVLCNVAVLTEGWDAPRTKACVLARGIGEAGPYLQMVGRIRRPHDGQRALVIDLLGNVYRHQLPDADREYSLDGIDAGKKKKDESLSQCKVCGFVVESAKRGLRCVGCGTEWPPPPRLEIKEQAVDAPGHIVSYAERFAEYQRLHAIATERGYKPGWIGIRFKETYGFWPTREKRRMQRAK